MKIVIPVVAGALCLANPANSGGFAEEIVEPVEVIEITEDRGSLPGWVVPVGLLVALAAIAVGLDSNGDGGNVVADSDQRLKTDVTRVGTTDGGLPLYQFRYIGQSQLYQGVMAQDVLRHRPEAVITGPLGVMSVDYGMLGLEMRAVD